MRPSQMRVNGCWSLVRLTWKSRGLVQLLRHPGAAKKLPVAARTVRQLLKLHQPMNIGRTCIYKTLAVKKSLSSSSILAQVPGTI